MSYSPRKQFLRRCIVGAVVVLVAGLTVLGGFVAVGRMQAEPAPDLPNPERVVKVNVQPEG